MNVLHITAWYPNAWVRNEAPFVQRHVQALSGQVSNRVWHIDVRTGDRWRSTRVSPAADRTFLLATPLRRWLVIEWIATVLILWAWFTRYRGFKVDIVNFHLAYPNCTRIRFLRWIMRRPMVITEHYSAYRIGYNAKSKGVGRIRRIFHANVPVIVVSEALANDIRAFAGPPAPTMHVIDNAVDTRVHRPDGTRPDPGRFFAIAGWRSPKRPDLLLEAVAILRAQGLAIRLRLAGSGPMDAEVRTTIDRLGLRDQVDILGHLEPEEVADEMRRAHALLHASDYETYSAVCAEALCCGTPVIASAVGGIVEYMHDGFGALITNAAPEAWADGIRRNWQRCLDLDRSAIAVSMAERAGSDTVGARYAALLAAHWAAQRTR